MSRKSRNRRGPSQARGPDRDDFPLPEPPPAPEHTSTSKIGSASADRPGKRPIILGDVRASFNRGRENAKKLRTVLEPPEET
jgi:hypothetical protein